MNQKNISLFANSSKKIRTMDLHQNLEFLPEGNLQEQRF